jgi:hypothetical protein
VGPAGDSHEQQADATAAAVADATKAPAGESMVRRQPDPQQGQGDSQQGQSDGGLQAATGQQAIELPVPEPVTLPIEGGSGPGDYEGPSNPNVLMAKHVDAPFLQRDDTPSQGSSGGGDAGGQPANQASAQSGVSLAGPKQAPYQIQVTRSLQMISPLSLDKLHLDFFDAPQISIGLDSQGTLSAQIAENLITMHLLENWKTPIDLSLAALWQQNLAPILESQQGGQLQATAKVTKTFNLTLDIQGMRVDSDDHKSRDWSVTAAVGTVVLF